MKAEGDYAGLLDSSRGVVRGHLRAREEDSEEDHLVAQFAADLSRFVPKLVYPVHGWRPQEEPQIGLVKGFDRSSTDAYIG